MACTRFWTDGERERALEVARDLRELEALLGDLPGRIGRGADKIEALVEMLDTYSKLAAGKPAPTAGIREEMARRQALISQGHSPQRYLEECVGVMFDVAAEALADIKREGKP